MACLKPNLKVIIPQTNVSKIHITMTNQVPLSTIHTFTIVAKESSFSRAAEILHITPSAVSHQMRQLEQQMNVGLFIRRSKGVDLTPAGKTLYLHASSGIKDIQHGLQQSRFSSQKQKLTIAVIPSLADLWLLPKLTEYKKEFPDIELEIIAQDQLVDFTTNQIDGHIHFGSGLYKGLETELLAHEFVYPVCHPDIFKGDTIEDMTVLLHSNTLLHYNAGIEDEPGGVSWADWLKHHQLEVPEHLQQMWFSHVAMSVNAAKRQLGITLGWHHMVKNDIESGNLVQISETRLQTKFSYYLAAPSASWQQQKFANFFNWLKSQF